MHVVVEPFLNVAALVRRWPVVGAEPAQERSRGSRGSPSIVTRPIVARGPASIVNVSTVRSGSCRTSRRGVDRGAKVAVVGVELLQRADGRVDAADGRRCAVAVGDRAAQRARRQPERAGELDPLNAVERNQVEAQRARRPARPSPRPGRPGTGRGCRCARSTRARRPSTAAGRRASRSDRAAAASTRRLVLDQQLDVGDLTAPTILAGRRTAPRRGRRQHRTANASRTRVSAVRRGQTPHQNLWRTRKSSAKVPSPFCVMTQPRRSF